LWFLWQISVRAFIRRAHIEGISEDPAWERRMSLLFCVILCFVALLALFLAAEGTATRLK
jgi:hypothetical protein